MFNQYPYINLNDLNLDYILNAIKEMRYEVTNFVSINAIKYADPIQWNITSQYEKNTIVIDPQTGTAYISVAPVPAGVALTRPEYWTVVFDLGSFVTRAAKNFTTRYEQDTTLTATFPTAQGDWLVWGDTLYVANVNITAGDSYVIDGNIRRITVEEVKNTIMQLIAENYDTIVAMIGNLDNLTTTDKDNVVAAINELVSGLSDEVQARQDADDALQDDIDTINTNIGDLNNLSTSDKSSVVNAINEVSVKASPYYTPEQLVADADLDDLNTILAALPSGAKLVLTKNKTYTINETITFSDCIIDGNNCAFSIAKDSASFGYDAVEAHKTVFIVNDNVSIENVNFIFGYSDNINEVFPNVLTINQRGLTVYGSNVVIKHCLFKYTQSNTILVYGENVSNVHVEDCQLVDCSVGIELETAADLTGADYCVTFVNCYSRSLSNNAGTSNSLFIGCKFEKRQNTGTGQEYAVFQAGINDALTDTGALSTCVNCTFIDMYANVNAIVVYGENTVSQNGYTGMGKFIGCVFRTKVRYGVRMYGSADFDMCTFMCSITCPQSIVVKQAIHINISNCQYLGNPSISGIQYLFAQTAVNNYPVFIAVRNTKVPYNISDRALLAMGSATYATLGRVIIENCISTANSVLINLTNGGMVINNKRADGETDADDLTATAITNYHWVCNR